MSDRLDFCVFLGRSVLTKYAGKKRPLLYTKLLHCIKSKNVFSENTAQSVHSLWSTATDLALPKPGTGKEKNLTSIRTQNHSMTKLIIQRGPFLIFYWKLDCTINIIALVKCYTNSKNLIVKNILHL